jgi:uncharacterized protein YbcI
MNKFDTPIAQQLGQAASNFEHQSTGHAPKSVTVVLKNTLVITLHGALSPADKAVGLFHREAATAVR